MPHPSSSPDDDIPYRCPKCCTGDHDDLKFPSLRSLRDHLENDHTAPTTTKFSPKFHQNGFNGSPITENFNREARELERQLKLAKDAELRHRQLWDRLVEPEYSALENIDREIRQSKMENERLNDALEDAVDKIEQMRHNAEMLTEDQRETVRRMQDQLALKEADLELLKTQLRALTEERSRLEKEKKELSSSDRHKNGLIQVLRNEISEKEAQLSDRQRWVSSLQ
jgi:DNA repair exonuclease SbcCD ATPase subunit